MILEGLLAGAGHVVAGPDHLVGVAPLAVDGKRRIQPALVGASWGLGHGMGVAALGVLAHTILSTAEVEIASVWAERLVGIVLIGLGLVALRRAKSLVIHEHAHTHDGDTHVHLHVHGSDHDEASHAKREEHGHGHAAFGIGIVHGLAGAGHFWVVLPSLALSRGQAAVFIGSYMVASLAVMTVFGAVLGRLAQSIGVAWLPKFLGIVGGLTLAVGVWWTIAAFG